MTRIATVLCLVAVALCLQSCASTHMKQYIGKDVRYIVLDSGAPENVMDMPDGRRAFQFRWGGGTYRIPKTTTTNGQVQLVGDSAYYSEQKLESGAVVVQSRGCLLTYFAKWDAQAKGWIVVDIRYPKGLTCG